MNILVIAHDASMYGASQSLLTALEGINKIRDRKILVLLPYNGKFGEALDALGIEHIVLPFPKCTDYRRRTRTFVNRLKKTYRYYRKLRHVLPEVRRVVQDFRPNVIYTNTSVITIGHIVGRRLRIPHVWHVREFGDLDYDYVYFPAKAYVKRCISSSKKCIFGSESLRNAWINAKKENSYVVYNGIFETGWNFPPRTLPTNSIKLGLVGGIVPGKGQDIAIRALHAILNHFPGCSLTLYGDVIDRSFHEKLLALIRDLKVEDKVTIKGFENDKERIFNNLDVLLSCSKMEGFGRTIVEAMARGIPVIGNHSGGVTEIIEDNVNGLLYRETSESLAKSLTTLLSSETIYNSLSINGITRAEEFSIPKYVEAIDKILFEAAMTN